MRKTLHSILLCSSLFACSDDNQARSFDAPMATVDAGPDAGALATFERVHAFNGQMPTGVAVSKSGRIFVNYPRWDDPIQFTVGELVNDEEVAYPDQATNTGKGQDHLYSVQSVVIDAQDRLWAVDTGSLDMGPPDIATAKLVAFDLKTDRIVRPSASPPTSSFRPPT